jgi:hypothetical protein
MYTWAHKLIVAAGMALAAGTSWGEDVVWFVVAENPNLPVSKRDSYLLPLTDPATIAAARGLLADGSTGIALTGIEAGGWKPVCHPVLIDLDGAQPSIKAHKEGDICPQHTIFRQRPVTIERRAGPDAVPNRCG